MSKQHDLHTSSIDDLVKQYVNKRNWIKEKDEQFKQAMSPHRQELKDIERAMYEYLVDNGLQTVKTEANGTVYRKTSQRAQITDFGAFVEYVKENDAFDLLQRRCNDSAVIERLEDGPIPGVDVHSFTTAGVRSK